MFCFFYNARIVASIQQDIWYIDIFEWINKFHRSAWMYLFLFYLKNLKKSISKNIEMFVFWRQNTQFYFNLDTFKLKNIFNINNLSKLELNSMIK